MTLRLLLNLAAACMLSHLLCGSAFARQDGAKHVTLIVENDIFAPAGQDRHYTSGIKLVYGLAGNAPSRWFSWIENLSLLGQAGDSHYALAAGQNVYTPEVFLEPRPILNDRPYAGWLYSELAMRKHVPGLEEAIAVSLGVVGPAALGEAGQKLFHNIVGDPKPAGWDNQLKNEPAVLLRYRRSWFLPLHDTGRLATDVVPRAGVSLGNVFTEMGAGVVLRLGNYLPERDLPARIQPGLSGDSGIIPVRSQHLDWMIYAEVQGRGVAHNIFLDGNTFTRSLSVEKRNFVWDAGAGFTLGLGQFHYPLYFSFHITWRGREFRQQYRRDSFGSALVGIQY
jgi:hypothetical protein